MGLILSGALSAEPAVYELAPAPDTHFELLVYKTGLMSGKVHTFVFDRYAGSVEYDPEAPENTQVEFTVDSDSIRCLDDWVNEKERGKILREARGAMLAVDDYPHLRFESNGLAAGDAGAFSAQGRLTIRDQTQAVQVEVKIAPRGKGLLVEGSAVVALEDFGLDPPSAVFGLVGTKSEMDVKFALRAAPAKE